MADYLVDDKNLYKVIKKNKRYIELALLPIISHDHIQINDTIGKSVILYDIDADVSKLEKFKTTNKIYKDWDDKYYERFIRNRKLVFETVYLDTLNETYYNKKGSINV